MRLSRMNLPICHCMDLDLQPVILISRLGLSTIQAPIFQKNDDLFLILNTVQDQHLQDSGVIDLGCSTVRELFGVER